MSALTALDVKRTTARCRNKHAAVALAQKSLLALTLSDTSPISENCHHHALCCPAQSRDGMFKAFGAVVNMMLTMMKMTRMMNRSYRPTLHFTNYPVFHYSKLHCSKAMPAMSCGGVLLLHMKSHRQHGTLANRMATKAAARRP